MSSFNIVELYIMASMGYPLLSLLYALHMRPKVETDIKSVESDRTRGLHIIQQKETTGTTMPMFVQVGQVSVPVGGGQHYTDTSWDITQTSYLIEHTPSTQTLVGATSLLPEKETLVRTVEYDMRNSILSNMGHIRKAEITELRNIITSYGLHTNIPMDRPLRLEYHEIRNPRIYIHTPSKYIHTDQRRLVRSVLFAKRLPGTLTIPITAAIIWGTLSLLDAAISNPYSEGPTNIFKKVFGPAQQKHRPSTQW